MKTHKVNIGAEPPRSFKELGSVLLEKNPADCLKYISGNLVAAIQSHVYYITDLVDVSTGAVCRLPMFDDYGAADCFSDKYDSSKFYAVVVKGCEAPHRRLLKLNTGEKYDNIIWQSSISSANGKFKWDETGEYLFYTDSKSIFTISKENGKTLKKYKREDTENLLKKKIIVYPSGNIFSYCGGNILFCGCKPKSWQLSVSAIEPLSNKLIWERELGKLEHVVAHVLVDNMLYLLCASGKFYKLEAATGETIYEQDTGHTYTKSFGFCVEGGVLSTYAVNRYDGGCFVAQFDIGRNTVTISDFSKVIQSDSCSGTIRNGLLYWIQRENVHIFDIAQKTEIFKTELKGSSEDFLFLGEVLYILQEEKEDGVIVQLG